MRSILSPIFLTILAALVIVISCKKPNNDTPPDPDVPNVPGKPIEYVITTIAGRVENYMREPLPGAVVKAGTMTTTTDINGEFRLNNVRVDKNAAFVTVDWKGLAKASRTMMVNANTVYYIKLIPTGTYPDGTVDGATGGKITNPNVYSLEFSPLSFVVRADKRPYTGTVTVSINHMDPSYHETLDWMPGTLRGIDSANKERGLKSYAIASIALTGAGGEKLELAPAKTAALSVFIPYGLKTQAQATIPLWSFNDTTGLWKEAGTAIKQGNFYVGNITNSSYWNFSYPIDLVDFKAVIKDQNGKPIFPGSVIFVSNVDSVNTGKETMDTTGMVTCKIPAKKQTCGWLPIITVAICL
jgi:hypothetical protein